MRHSFGPRRAACLLWLSAAAALAQHEGYSYSTGPAETPTPAPAPASASMPGDGSTTMTMTMTPADGSASAPTLFSSDMTAMTGMRPSDPMASMAMPGWHVSDLGIARLLFNRQGGPSGGQAVESSNWNMLHAQHDLAGGRLTFMLMNSSR